MTREEFWRTLNLPRAFYILMRTHINPVRTEEPAKDAETALEEAKARLRGDNDAWHLGRRGRDEHDPMAGMNGSQVDLTQVIRRRRFRR